MKNFKKMLLAISLLLMMSPVMAAGIGYVDYEAVANALPASISIKKQMDAKKLQIKNYAAQSQKLIDAQKTDALKRKVGQERIAQLNAMRKEYYDLRTRRVNLVRQKVDQGSLVVLKQRNLDVVISKTLVIQGGIDITQDIIKAAK